MTIPKSQNEKTKKALIVGCGFVGSRLCEVLLQNDWFVDSIRRSGPESASQFKIDVSEEFSLNTKYDVVFYTVAAKSYDHKSYRNAYYQGLKNTIAAIERSGHSSHLIFTSSTSLFAESHGGTVNEESPIRTEQFSHQSLWSGEELIKSSGLPCSILRLSGIYGPGRCHLIQQIQNDLARQKRRPFISNRIHIEDCASALMHLANLKGQDRELYIGSDHEPTPYNEVLQWLSEKLGKPAPAFEDQASQSVHMSNKRCSNHKLLKSGFMFKYPTFRQGLLSCL